MKSSIVIKLNGSEINSDIDGIESFIINYRESDEEGALTKSYSTELTFYGDGYNILKTALIDNPNGFVNSVNVEVFDDCCNQLVFKGVIRGDSIDWCEPECWISCQIVEETPELTCIKSTLLYDNHDNFLDQQQKKIRYCVEMRPQFVAEVILNMYAIWNTTIYVILFPLSLAIIAIQTVAFLICSLFCVIPGTGCTQNDCNQGQWTHPSNAFDEISFWLDDLQDRMIQCQWYHPTALVRDYIENVCRKCGLTFQSSILNDPASPYYNLLLFSAPVRKGYKPSETNGLLITENLPIETVDTLMQRYLKPLFNAKYWVVDGVLIFERRDYFQNTNIWVNSEQLLNDGRIIDNRICLSWIDEKKYAYGIYKYLDDASDVIASEASDRYNTIVEWNNPPSEAQSEFMDNQFMSGMARFRDDEAGWEVFQYMFINNFFLGNAINDSRNLLLMSQHTAFNYKFLIWDESSGLENARIKRDYSNGFTGGSVIGNKFLNISSIEISNNQVPLDPNKLFNYPMWFNENNTNNLYTLFHYINNPRTPGNKLYDFSFTFEFDCGEFNAIDFTKNIRLKIGNQIKFGEIKELAVDFVKRTIAVKGIV